MNEMTHYQATHRAMGTIMTHKAFGGEANQAITSVCAEIANLELLMSRFIPESEISRVNRSAGTLESEPLSKQVLDVLLKSKELSQLCQGLFDITSGPLVNLWHLCKHTQNPPSQADIDLTLPLINDQDLILDPYQQTAFLNMPGQAIDLGGIGKGFAGDQIIRLYDEFGIRSAFSNLGGNVAAVGSKPDGSPWRVGIQHPRKPSDLVGWVAVTDKAVVTSGDYQRAYLSSSEYKYHHILNLRTGYPSESDLISVTVVAKQGVIADALSTALFVAGLENAIQILKSFTGVEVVLIDQDLQVFVSDGLETCFYPQSNIKIGII